MTRSSSMAERRPHLMQVVLSLTQGGSETLARDIALGIDPGRWRTSICALDAGGPLAAALGHGGIPVHILGRRPGFDWRLIPRLFRLFSREGVDVVQTHHLAPLIYSALAARAAGAALVHVEHDRFSFASAKARRRLRTLSTLCHRVVVVGDDIYDYFVKAAGIPPDKLTVIHNGVDLRRYSAAPLRPRSALGLPATGRLIGHVARLDPAKDQYSLLQAFKRVLTVHPDTYLVMVGDGPLRQELASLAASLALCGNVVWLGRRNDVPDLLPHFDIFALTSVNEGLPIALLEAMACARPVVATAVGDVPTIIEHDTTGLLITAGDAKALADAVTILLDRPDHAGALGRSARSLVERRFSLADTLSRYERLYESLARS